MINHIRIIGCDCYEKIESLNLVIANIKWQLVVRENDLLITYEDVLNLEIPSSDNFIEFENLTQEMIVNWVKSSIGDIEINRLIEQLRNKINTKLIENYPLPWQKTIVPQNII